MFDTCREFAFELKISGSSCIVAFQVNVYSGTWRPIKTNSLSKSFLIAAG